MTRTPTITIDPQSPVPAYRQIVDAMRHLLVESELKPGDQVQPVRQLALDLSVHFNTVAQAYRVLADEGWLDLKRRRGAIVLDRAQPDAPGRSRQQDSFRKLRELTAQLRAEGIPAKQLAVLLRKLADGIEEN
jgi:DNA-binding transcriptional regulator YhcF (GntR family)